MKQILLAFGFPRENGNTITILFENTKAMVHSPDVVTEFFDIVTGVLQLGTYAEYLFILLQNYLGLTSIDLKKIKRFHSKKKKKKEANDISQKL